MKQLLTAVLLGASLSASAGSPLISVVALSPTKLNLKKGDVSQVNYLITNNGFSYKSIEIRQLGNGLTITPSTCALNGKQSCTINIAINASQMTGNVIGGPSACNGSTDLQCYQPIAEQTLVVMVTP